MSLFDRMRRAHMQPTQPCEEGVVRLAGPATLPATPQDVAALTAQLRRTQEQLAVRTDEAAFLRQRNTILADELKAAERRAARAADAAEALRARITGDPAAQEAARLHRTVLDYEDQLATCRRLHGTNTRSSTTVPTGIM